MLSRVADSIYWLNRYIERAENIARFLDVNLNLLLDMPIGVGQQWEPLVLTTGDLPYFQSGYGEITAENVIQFLTFDANYPNSIVSCLQAARDNAASVREVISSEMWQQINSFYTLVRDASKNQSLPSLANFLEEVKQASHLFVGVTYATMTHNEGWHFGKIGRLLERADKTTRILDVKYFLLLPSPDDVGTTIDEIGWMALLKSASAYEMYRKRGLHRITPAGVAEFLILETEFPRSIRFCLREAERSLHHITGSPIGTWRIPVERSLGRLRAELDYLTMDEIVARGMHEFLDQFQNQINQLGESIFETFFDLGALVTQTSQSQFQSQYQ